MPDGTRLDPYNLNVKPHQRRTIRTRAVVVSLCLAYPSHSLTAQAMPAPNVAAVELPDAPGFQASSSFADPDPHGTASLSGIVVDPTGAAVAGVRITLAAEGAPVRTITADNTGAFIFRDLPAGTFTLTILSSGNMGSFVSPGIYLLADEQRQLPNIMLSVAAASTNVEVTASQSQVSAAQLQEELHQRALGIFPNFYSSYIWNAAPLTTRQKYVLALRSTTDPVNFLATGIVAGAEQAKNVYPGYGQGAQGYAKRYGAAYADDFDARMIGSAVLPSLLHQDPRYFYKGSGTVRSRVLYALKSAVITRGDNGQLQPNYSYVLGSFASGAIANAYYPAASRGAGLTIGNGFLNIAGHAADDLVREFVLRRLTPGVPATENGQP
jgi:Carboxypeptidase regulatory-like domain